MMSDIAEKTLDVRNAPVKKHVYFTAEDVTTADTITLDELTTINLAYLIDRSAGTAVTFTNATNVITITGSYSDVDIVGIAVGV
uniref:Uncharacterized protein n=2 Tax=viral metagenome TaxID=1070528 RepID=A0A6M3K3Z8_9ZZZZ